MILALHYYFPSSNPRLCRLQKVPAKYPDVPSSILSFRLHECSAGWVSLMSSTTCIAMLTNWLAGCHALALDLVRTWSFERPSVTIPDGPSSRPPPSPVSARFALEPALLRRSSILIDMDVTTAPPTRGASPAPRLTENGRPASPTRMEEELKEGDVDARKAGLGSLIKSAKQDVKVPEFDMNAFF